MRKLIPILLLFTSITTCSSQNHSENVLIKSNAIILEAIDGIEVGNIRDIKIDKDGNFFVLCNTTYVKQGCALKTQLLSFNKNGQWRKKIFEEGEKEIDNIRAFSIKGEHIYVADVNKHLIHKLNLDGEYLGNSQLCSMNCYDLFIDSDDNFITYDPVVSNPESERLIQIQTDSVVIKKFGLPTILAQKFFPCPNHGFAIDSKNNIYQANSHEYKIYKYNSKGDILQTFANDNNSSLCKSMPNDFQLRCDQSEEYTKELMNSFNWIQSLNILHDQYLSICYIVRTSDSINKYYIDLLDLKGNLLKCNIELPANLIGSSTQSFFLVPNREEIGIGKYKSPEIHIYELNPKVI